MAERDIDVLVVGGGLGGVAAALGALRGGARVLLTEEYTWLGGQLTTQLVPPDEHPWVESTGVNLSYRQFRTAVRGHYRREYPLTEQSRALSHLNPGAGGVGPLCHEPTVAVQVLARMLAPWVAAGRLEVLYGTYPEGAEIHGDRIATVRFAPNETFADGIDVRAAYVIDATESGELLPLAGVEHVTGAEARDDTGEPHAADVAAPGNTVAVSWCAAVSHHAGEDHTIDRPRDYQYWRALQPEIWPGRQFGWVAPHPITLEPRDYAFTPNPDDDPARLVADQSRDNGADDLWTFRRILARRHLRPDATDSDITVINWPQIDYLGGTVYGARTEPLHAAAAKAQSRAFLYWLQTEAPRPDGGTGYPGLRPRPDVAGTEDGFAMAPYIRESRRILGQYRISELDVAFGSRGERGAVVYHDSVGVGAYRIDLHPSVGGDTYIDVMAWPFHIPLRALVPQRIRNLLAGGKCLSTTHITAGCYRLHPSEWATGEAAGTVAAFCLDQRTEPHALTEDPASFAQLRTRLEHTGIQTRWASLDYRPY